MPAPVLWLAMLVAVPLSACEVPTTKTDPAVIAALPRLAVPGGDGTTLSVITAGDPGGLPVLLLHGTPGDGEGWADVMLTGARGFFFCAVDRPGFGHTLPKAPRPDIDAQITALLPLLDWLGQDGRGQGRVIVLGHSLGGPLAALLAIENPERVAGIVIAGGSLDPDLEEIHWAQHLGRVPPFSWLAPSVLLTANEELFALEAGLRRLSPRLAGVKAAVHIIHGSKDDLVPVANVDFMRRAFTAGGAPAPAETILDGVDHFLPWNEPQRLVDAIRAVAQAAGLPAPPPRADLSAPAARTGAP